MKHFFLAFLIIIITSCNEDSIEASENPETHTVLPKEINLSMNKGIPNEEIVLEGEFDISEDYKITLNDEEIEISEITKEFMKFLIPAGLPSGILEITVGNETKILSENFEILKPIYLFKRIDEDYNRVDEVRKVYAMNTESEQMIEIADINSSEYLEYFSDPDIELKTVFNSETQEIYTISDFNTLLTINTQTGEVSKKILTTSMSEVYKGITIDANNIYLFKGIKNSDYGDIQYVFLIKYDIKTGEETIVLEFPNDDYLTYFGDPDVDLVTVFNSSTNDILVLSDFKEILKMNITDQTIEKVILNEDGNEEYKGLTLDENNQLYMFKRNKTTDVRSFISYNTADMSETTILTLDKKNYFPTFGDSDIEIFTVYNIEDNTINVISEYKDLLRINLANPSIDKTVLSTTDYINYKGITIGK